MEISANVDMQGKIKARPSLQPNEIHQSRHETMLPIFLLYAASLFTKLISGSSSGPQVGATGI